MKKTLLTVFTLFVFLSTIQLVAQETSVPRKPLIEVFTSSSCPPCVLGNLVVDGVLDNHEGAYSLVKYQMNWPGNGDPYYLEASFARRSYYNVTGVPSLKTNGVDGGYPGSWTQAMFNNLAGTTHMTIAGQAAVTTAPGGAKTGAMMVNCQIDLTALEAYGTGLRAYAVLVEQKTFMNATTNGETEFHNVVQGYLLSSDGEELGAIPQDEIKSFDLTLDLTGSNVETGNDLTVVVFVQDYDSKEIIQSEMFEVAHPFVDYSATFTLYDDGYNPIEGGKLMVEMGGTVYAENGQVSIDKLFPGTYNYEMVVPGYLPSTGTFTITDSDLEGNLVVEVPPFRFYEDFENSGVPPAGWTLYNPQGDYFAWDAGTLVYQKSAALEDAVYLVLPKIAIDQGCVATLKAGESSLTSYLGIGVTTTPDDPAATYTEVTQHEIFNLDYLKTFGSRMDPQTLGDGYICFKITSADALAYFYMDDCIVIENVPGYKVQFLVTDQNGEVLPEAEVTFNGEAAATNDFGYATWRDVDEAEYEYSASYKGEVFATGTVEVWGDMVEEVVHNTSGITLTEKEAIGFYPNPANSQITIQGATTGSALIMNLSGQTVVEQSIALSKTISIKDLPKGVYFVRIKANGEEIVKKLLKQ